MKVWNVIVKIAVALAAIAGVVYVAATYGDQIVAWCKKMVSCCEKRACKIVEEAAEEEIVEAAEEVEAPVEEVLAEEAPAVEEADFEN